MTPLILLVTDNFALCDISIQIVMQHVDWFSCLALRLFCFNICQHGCKFHYWRPHAAIWLQVVHHCYTVYAELAGHIQKLDVKLQSLCGSGFSLFAVRMLAKHHHLGVNWLTTHCEAKDGVHFLLSILNAIIGITSYHCVMLKIVTLYDGIKTNQNGVFLFSLKEQNLASF